jgi:hypothetical protein
VRSRGSIAVGLLVGALSLALFVVLPEGVTSLVSGESLWRRALDRADPAVPLPLEPLADRTAVGALTPGPYALDPDPVVGFRLKSSALRTFAGVRATLDEYGQRIRIGPEPEADATRIVVLGDSVAFGWGIADGETYAQRLEELLAATMESGRPRPCVRTVACPGWAFQNEFRYLANHLDRLDPDVVLYLPVGNDLDDSYAVNEVGERDSSVDPSLGPAWPQVSNDAHVKLLRTLPSQSSSRSYLPMAHYSDLTPESHRRWSRLVDELGRFEARLSARGCRLALVLYDGESFGRTLEHRVTESLPELPLMGLFATHRSGDTLGDDPHPNARCVAAGAWRMASFLLERGWIPGAGAVPPPPQDPDYAGRGMALHPRVKRLRIQAQLQARAAGKFEEAIDLREERGLHQVYGGLLGDGTVGKALYVALENSGASGIALEIECAPRESAIHPLSLAFRVNGVEAGTVPVPVPESDDRRDIELSVPLPDPVRDDPYLDVLVTSSSWIQTGDAVRPCLYSYRLLRLGLR